MFKRHISTIVIIYAFCHFAVDLACITTVLATIAHAFGPSSIVSHAFAVLVYDMVAFCMQLPLGAFLDALGPRRWGSASLASFALVAAGCLAALGPSFAAGIAVLLVAFGNALFHCAGGEEVLLESAGKASYSGIFISTGAAGVFLGGLASFQGWVLSLPLIIALLVASAALVGNLEASQAEAEAPDHALDRHALLAIALLCATVALRSYVGMVMAFPWKSSLALAAVSIGSVVAGKALGGVLADRIGTKAASIISLGGAAPLFVFSWDSAPAGIAATLLFNFTMAITLSSLANLLPRARGAAFGLASFSLAIGALPALVEPHAASPAALCALSAASLTFLLSGLAAASRSSNTSA